MKELRDRWNKRVLVIEIDPEKLKYLWKRFELGAGYTATLGLIVMILVVSFHTKASIANFYPQNCLGGWQNPKYAEGEPDVKEITKTTDFSPENSAMLDDTAAQIFCGDFRGEIPEDANARRFTLRLSFLASEQALVSIPIAEPVSEETQDAITGEQAPADAIEEKLEEIMDAVPEASAISEEIKQEILQEVREEPKESAPEPEPVKEETPPEPAPAVETPPAENIISIFLKKFLPVAFAQEETTPPQAAPLLIEEGKDSSPRLDEEGVGGGDAEIIEIRNEKLETNPAPVNIESDFLEVSYTLDGEVWNVLGKINRQNMANPYFEIPFEQMNWENIRKVQVAVSAVPTFDKPPIFYLDAMWIETEYEEMSDVELLDKKIPEEQPVLPLSVKLGANPDKSLHAELYMDTTSFVRLTEKINKKSHYYIFSVLDRNANGSYCAKFTGRIWITGEPPFTYGTCFGNDTGEFEIIETTEDIFWNYTDFDSAPDKVLSRTVFTIPANLPPAVLAE